MLVSEREYIIENTNSTFRLLEGNILHIYYKRDTELQVQDIIEVEKAYNALEEPKPMKIIQEMGPYAGMSAEARKYAAEHSPKLTAVAYVLGSLAQRLLIKFYVRMWKRDKPTKVFDTFDQALAWIKPM